MNTQQRKQLIEAVESDDRITNEERETSIHFDSVSDRLSIESAHTGIARRLLAHPEFEIKHVVQQYDRTHYRTVEEFEEFDSDLPIVFVTGYAPIGLLKITKNARDQQIASSTVTGLHLADIRRDDDE